ncbi:MAG TPA: hypothetical protein VMZ90_13055 [Vicinamibacterales bacterium]|nr:hypothetical protein [Vicinamibacterales bacterium]
MADPIVILRQATILMKEAEDALEATAATQALRWARLRRVVEAASDQYWDMRIGAIEESMRDKGAPMWLSIVVSVGLTFIPITALTTRFLGPLTSATQKLLTRGDRTRLAQQMVKIERELDADKWIAASDRADDLIKQIAKTEASVLRFYKDRDPEYSNLLQNMADKLSQAAINKPFEGAGVSKTVTKGPKGTAPIVVVKSQFYDWIDSHMNAEQVARREQRERVKNLFAIATSTEPKKESKERFQAARDAEAARQPKIPYRRPTDPLPEKADDALEELKRIRDDAKPTPDDLFTPSEKDELTDLQLIIEGAIWASAYDFTPVFKKSDSKIGPLEVKLVPLSDDLWKRLIERYIDPDKAISYKDVGPTFVIGTQAKPGISEKLARDMLKFNSYSDEYFKGWTPKARLSWFFGKLLYPNLLMENSKIVQTIKGS